MQLEKESHTQLAEGTMRLIHCRERKLYSGLHYDQWLETT